MNIFIFAFYLLAVAPTVLPDDFRKIGNRDVPPAAISAICYDERDAGCRQDFLENGEAYEVSVNATNEPALLIFGGNRFAGSGGETYALVQKLSTGWRKIETEGWQIYHGLHLKKLSRTRDGYHDLRLGRTLCVKWDGKFYVEYEAMDYRELPEAMFDVNSIEDAELLWLIRYAGETEFQFEPRWMPRPSDIKDQAVNERARVDAEGKEGNFTTVAVFRGGVWGVRNEKAFLLLPRPAYLGADDLKVDHDWLIVYGDSCGFSTTETEIARYNLRTGMLKIQDCVRIPFGAN